MAALVNYNQTRVLSAETRAKLSAASKGIPKSPEHRARLLAAVTGRALSGATRKRLSAQKIGNRNALDAPIKGECVYCFGPATGYDHVVPLSRGGTDTAENKVLACRFCNASKANRTPEEWLAGRRQKNWRTTKVEARR